MQIFNILNARRPSVKDLNPLQGISALTCVSMMLMICFQFFICYIPLVVGYSSIDIMTNLACMGVGVLSVVWLVATKMVLTLLIGDRDAFG
jgi:hypothetical protein